jgi:glucose/arabinose dehydrogenase
MVTPALNSGSDVTWAPSGIAYVDGRLYFAGLRGSSLYEARPTETGAIADFAAHLTGRYGRLRAVVVGPDGFLYVTTSNRDGRGTPKPGDDIILQVHQDLLRAAP